MASSSMCGPSNPLQSLKNHASFDRSLHQDRFRPSPQPSTQFRHQHLTPQTHDEFDQFLSTSPGPSQTLRTRPSLQNFSLASSSPTPQQQSWAADFQRLQINTPPPSSLQAHKPPMLSGWGAEFLSQMNAPAAAAAQSPISQQKSPIISANSDRMGMGLNAGYLGVSSYNTALESGYTVETSKATYTDAEFDQMFEEAAFSATQAPSFTDFPQREVPIPLMQENIARTQMEEIKPEDVKEDDRPRDDADELARTAGQLVDTLSQDTSKKFQESQFVALMRKLRDKTVKVEDGKMVEV